MPRRDGSSQCSRTQRRSTECEVTQPNESAAEKESTSLERGEATLKMEEKRDQLRTHRVKKFGHLRGRALKYKSVSTTTAERYLVLLERFDLFVLSVHQMDGEYLVPGEFMDGIVAGFFEELFFDGGASHLASSTFAALGWRAPAMSRHGSVPMPRSRQSLAAFRQLDPGRTRMPLPPGVVSLYVEWFKKADLFWTAVGIALACCLYLRPKELCELRWSQVHPPSSHVGMPSWSVLLHPEELQVSSKTGRFNDTLAVDGHIGQLLSDALARGKVTHSPGARLIQVPQDKLARLFTRAGHELNLDVLGPPVLYQLRHAGASRDLVTGERNLMEVKRRGRWMSDKSVLRYTKGGRLAEQMARLPPSTAKLAVAAWENLNATLVPPSRCLRA